MSSLTLAQRVIESAGTNESLLPVPRIVSRIPDALLALAVNVEASEKKELLRKTFTANLASGTADLTSLITGDNYLLLSSLKSADIFVSDFSYPLQYVPDRSSLALSRSPVFGYYTVEGVNLYTANVADGTLTFRASYVPQLASLPEELGPELISILTTMMGAPQ